LIYKQSVSFIFLSLFFLGGFALSHSPVNQ
jgi:hypothetical protein